jgi:uncharacterized membrane protein (DUF2068 family)
MRSQFLTLLCILTFLSCAWGIADATVSLLQTDAISEPTQVEKSATPKPSKPVPQQYYEDRSSGDEPMATDPILIKKLAAGQLVYSLITLIGAILMFRLRRVGFWIYVAGTAIGITIPIILLGFGALNMSFGVFFSLLFIGLYWLTFKEMH